MSEWIGGKVKAVVSYQILWNVFQVLLLLDRVENRFVVAQNFQIIWVLCKIRLEFCRIENFPFDLSHS